jgi:hypothetical protein
VTTALVKQDNDTQKVISLHLTPSYTATTGKRLNQIFSQFLFWTSFFDRLYFYAKYRDSTVVALGFIFT